MVDEARSVASIWLLRNQDCRLWVGGEDGENHARAIHSVCVGIEHPLPQGFILTQKIKYHGIFHINDKRNSPVEEVNPPGSGPWAARPFQKTRQRPRGDDAVRFDAQAFRALATQ